MFSLFASSTADTSNNIDTISTIIVPAKLLDKVSSDLRGQGFGIDNQYSFKSLVEAVEQLEEIRIK